MANKNDDPECAPTALGLVTSDEYARGYRGFKEQSARRERMNGTGPRFFRLGRRVYYDPADVRAWCEARKFTSTAEATEASASRLARREGAAIKGDARGTK